MKAKDNYLGSRKSKGKIFNRVTENSGKLDRQGRIYKNNLLDVDMTSQIATRRKLK